MATLSSKVLHGTLDMLILKALCHGSMHGYGVARRLKQLSFDALKVEEGSLYPALFRLEQQGHVKSDWGISDNNQRARYYALTRSGRKQLEAEADNWQKLSMAVTLVLQST